MVHGLDTVGTAIEAVSVKEDTAGFERFVAPVNYVVTIISSIALVVAAFVLSYSVASRYFFHFSTDWQDEFSVFLIVGAVFMSAPRCRRAVVMSPLKRFLPCCRRGQTGSVCFWLTLHRSCFALSLPGSRGSCCTKRSSKGIAPGSTWQPPLWIPYSLMTCGMVLLSIQLILQVATHISRWNKPA